MTRSSLAGALALATLIPSAAFAQLDCHQNMKDMLQGTLEMSKKADVWKAEDDGSHGCTIAEWQEWSPALDSSSTVQWQGPVFQPSVLVQYS